MPKLNKLIVSNHIGVQAVKNYSKSSPNSCHRSTSFNITAATKLRNKQQHISLIAHSCHYA